MAAAFGSVARSFFAVAHAAAGIGIAPEAGAMAGGGGAASLGRVPLPRLDPVKHQPCNVEDAVAVPIIVCVMASGAFDLLVGHMSVMAA